jgi:4-amino-4-deoxy-L-arabinose transferase-like glycosyltransferase
MSEVSSVTLDAPVASPAASGPGKPRGARWTSRAAAAAAFIAGTLLALASMCARPTLPGGLWIGTLGTVLSVAALLRLIATGRDTEVQRVVALRTLAAPLGHAVAASIWLWVLLRLAVAGVLPAQTAVLAAAVPLGFIWLVAATATLVRRLGFLADPERPLWRRQGFWLVAITALLYLPRLGSFGLIDPWETHYGEVAREMLSRDDWISLWWAQDGWFWSKPISNFWAQALSFSALGVAWGPDQMLAAVAQGRTPQPEWAARLPVFLMALGGQHALYLGARPYVGRWAAFWGTLVLATTPYWYFLTRQSMADMAYVGPLCGAMGCVLLALHARPEARVGVVGVRLWGSHGSSQLRLSGFHLLLGAMLLLALPQIIYLLSRNVLLEWGELPLRLGVQLDHVALGSPGNCGLPGNQACRPDPAGNAQALQPAQSALIWAACAALLAWLRRGERREKRLWYLAAWLCVALSFMGKGAPGLVLVLATYVGFVVVRGRLAELAEADWLGLGLVMACVAMPWFVQEYLRHGSEFFERLFIHDMYKRAFSHVHDTNKGDDTSFRYYVWQLGYGLFPWSGLCAAGTLYCLGKTTNGSAGPSSDARARVEDEGARGVIDLTYFCVLWQLASFGMFGITGTKYHHYALPLVPAATLLAGVFCQQLFERRRPGERPSVAEGAGLVAAAVFVGLAGRDLAVTHAGDVQGAARFLHLFTYNYARTWPATLDYSKTLWVFTAIATALCLGMLARRWRSVCFIAFAAFSTLMAAWVIDVYFVEVAPHWGQRETISVYYQRRAGPQEPLVAYQLNWKGENFYTGNDVPAFVSSGKRFTDWVAAQKASGVQVMFFTTEHSRIGTLKRELGSTRKFELLTTPELNDKFVLARAEL